MTLSGSNLGHFWLLDHSQLFHTPALRRKAQHLPAGDPRDPTSRRLRDVRSADDGRFGFLGPRAEAEQITQERGTVLQHTLTLE
jgi:hypothetical protein